MCQDGERTAHLTRIAGYVLGQGMSVRGATAFCLAWNARNQPPLHATKIAGTVLSLEHSARQRLRCSTSLAGALLVHRFAFVSSMRSKQLGSALGSRRVGRGRNVLQARQTVKPTHPMLRRLGVTLGYCGLTYDCSRAMALPQVTAQRNPVVRFLRKRLNHLRSQVVDCAQSHVDT